MCDIYMQSKKKTIRKFSTILDKYFHLYYETQYVQINTLEEIEQTDEIYYI